MATGLVIPPSPSAWPGGTPPQFGHQQKLREVPMVNNSCSLQQKNYTDAEHTAEILGRGACASPQPASLPETVTQTAKIDQENISPGSLKPPAVEAVCLMGIGEHLVQLAVDVYQLENTGFPSAEQLFLDASEIQENPEKQEELKKKLDQRREKATAKENPAKQEESKKKLDQAHPQNRDKATRKETYPGLSKPAPIQPQAKNQPEENESRKLSAGVSEAAVSKPIKPSSTAVGKPMLQKRLRMLARRNHKLKQRKVCRACRKAELATSGITFLPCGHFITCEVCSEKYDNCPACGKNIMGTVRTFLS